MLNVHVPEATPECPDCGSTSVARIVYGMPTRETDEAVRRGEAVLGGCVVMGDGAEPVWWCRACESEFSVPPARGAP